MSYSHKLLFKHARNKQKAPQTAQIVQSFPRHRAGEPILLGRELLKFVWYGHTSIIFLDILVRRSSYFLRRRALLLLISESLLL